MPQRLLQICFFLAAGLGINKCSYVNVLYQRVIMWPGKYLLRLFGIDCSICSLSNKVEIYDLESSPPL